MQQKFTKEDLRQMTMRQLRLIDITNVDDEKIIQEVINERLEENPGKIDVKTSDVPDIKTPEQEAEWQKILDERRARKKDRLTSSVTPAEGDESTLDDSDSSDNKDTNEADKDASDSTEDDAEFVDHTVTEEDLERNPGLKDEGVSVGDVIQIPKYDGYTPEDEDKKPEVLGEKELGKMKTAELIEYAKSIDLEFDKDTVTNNPQRVQAILDFQNKA